MVRIISLAALSSPGKTRYFSFSPAAAGKLLKIDLVSTGML